METLFKFQISPVALPKTIELSSKEQVVHVHPEELSVDDLEEICKDFRTRLFEVAEKKLPVTTKEKEV